MSPLRGVAKGNAFARKVAEYLNTEVRALAGAHDRGDLVHPTWTVEVKCPGRDQPVRLSHAMTQVRRAAANNGQEFFCVISRYTGHSLEEAFFTIPLDMATRIIPQLKVET
jgi:hypothetical protein